MRIEEMNWMDVEKYLKHDDRVIVVLGATEQHGYLSLLTDTLIPMKLADEVSQRTKVLVVPPLNFGISPYFTTYPGTISLRVESFLAVVEDIFRSLYGYGFRRFLVLNGHGGNAPAQPKLIELANQLEGLQVKLYSWWTADSVAEVAQRHGIETQHANWLEAFDFTKVGNLPKMKKAAVLRKGLLNAKETRETYGDGSFGGDYEVKQEIMEELFQVILKDALELVEF
jgi:creatinine amidohydrolase